MTPDRAFPAATTTSTSWSKAKLSISSICLRVSFLCVAGRSSSRWLPSKLRLKTRTSGAAVMAAAKAPETLSERIFPSFPVPTRTSRNLQVAGGGVGELPRSTSPKTTRNETRLKPWWSFSVFEQFNPVTIPRRYALNQLCSCGTAVSTTATQGRMAGFCGNPEGDAPT